MLRHLNRLAAGLVVVIGLLHLAVGHAAFTSPTERAVWFVSAKFLLVTTGLANMASSTAATRLQIAAAASGSVAILILGALIASADRDLLFAPQTLVLLALGVLLSALRLHELLSPRA